LLSGRRGGTIKCNIVIEAPMGEHVLFTFMATVR